MTTPTLDLDTIPEIDWTDVNLDPHRNCPDNACPLGIEHNAE